MPALHLVIQSLILVTAVSMDAFVASFSYGVKKIRIPLSSCFLMSLICTGVLGISMLFGSILGTVLPDGIIGLTCFLVLLFIGLVKLFDSVIKRWISKQKKVNKQVSFRFFSLHMILRIYADPSEADKDASSSLSPSEAAGLAVALSFDSLAAGFGAGLADKGIWLTLLLSLGIGVVCVVLGESIGQKFSRKIPYDISWLSGLLLIILAIIKLF